MKEDRPTSRLLAPLPWQRSIWQHLWQSHQADRLPHALLFSGQSGLGKGLLALAFGKALLCEHNNSLGQACGQCQSCLLLRAGSHPNFYYLEPEPPQHRIKIDPIRQLIYSLQQTTLQGRYKVVIIASVDSMMPAASNALLKSLEEPTPDSVFILLTHRLGLLPATIRSRCQLVRWLPPLTAVAQSWLRPYLGEGSEDILRLAAGAPLRALAMAKTDRLGQYQMVLESLIDLLTAEVNPSQTAAVWAKLPHDELLDDLLLSIAELIKWQFALREDYLLPQSLMLLQQVKPKINCVLLYHYLDKVQQIQRELLLAPLNLPLWLEDMAYALRYRVSGLSCIA